MTSPAESSPVKWAELLGSTFPGPERQVSGLSEKWGDATWTVATPAIQVYCDSIACSRPSFYDFIGTPPTPGYNQWTPLFLFYRCRNCKQTEKLYAVLVRVVKLQGSVRERAIKMGEVPAYGSESSGKLNPLLEPAADLYQKGQLSERQGLGLAAFVYYRHVAEKQRGLFLDEIVKVCEQVGTDARAVAALRAAKAETSFSRAADQVAGKIPNLLCMSGHDPFSLLRAAFEEGAQAETDQQALEVAASVRVIMNDLAERINRALRDHTDVRVAVKRLLQARPVSSTLPPNS